MQDVVDPFTRRAHRSGIAQVYLPEIDPVIISSQIRCFAGEVVVDSADFFAALYQGSRQGRSDKPCDSRNQIFRHAVVPRICSCGSAYRPTLDSEGEGSFEANSENSTAGGSALVLGPEGRLGKIL